jgi:hypothetical protein
VFHVGAQQQRAVDVEQQQHGRLSVRRVRPAA